MTEPVQYSLEDGVARIQLDDGKANALSYPLMDAFMAALDRAEREARAILLVGRAGRFSAGFDLKVMMTGPAAAVAMLRRGAQLFTRLYGFPRPVVAACTGHAIAGGSLLLLTADHRIGADGDFKIGLNEVSIQMTLPRLGMELARDRLDPRRLTEATLFARIYSPREAVDVGYLDAVAAPDALIETAAARAAALAKLPSDAFAGTKLRLREYTLARIGETLERDLNELSGAMKGA